MSHGSRAILPPFVSYDQGKKHQLCSQTRLTNFWLLLTTMFSLWSFSQENVPNHYPQLFTLGWKLEGSNWLTNIKSFWKICSTVQHCTLQIRVAKSQNLHHHLEATSNYVWSQMFQFLTIKPLNWLDSTKSYNTKKEQ